MAEVKWLEHKSRKIFLMDFAYSEISELMKAINDAKTEIAKQPPVSVLGLVDVSASPFNKDVADALKDLSMANKPYIKISVVVGVEGIKKVIYQAVLRFTGRKNLVLRSTRQEAMDFLAEQ